MDKDMKKERADIAVSEIVGTILLLSIAVALFVVLTVVVLSYPFSPSPPSVNIIGTIETNEKGSETFEYIVLEHRGGESLDPDTEILLNIGDKSDYTTAEKGFLNNKSKKDGWNIGEILVYDITEDYSTDLHVGVVVVDIKSSSIIMMSTLQEGKTST